MKDAFSIKSCLLICTLFAFTLSMSAQKISFTLNTDQTVFKPGDTEVQLEYILINHSTDNFIELEFVSHITNWRNRDLSNPILNDWSQGDPNGNGILDAGETWLVESIQSLYGFLGETLILGGAVKALNESHEIHTSGDATLLHFYGINMDVDIQEECAQGLNKLNVDLITRLLIDEDAAKNPGTTIITVGGIDIEIPLPASQWEARDLLITADYLNGGVMFDPFNPPPDVILANFCEQDSMDQGRNANNVLDECEPINTVRAPCLNFDEDDILCEFPDWKFSYCFIVEDNLADADFIVTAADDFAVWKADENPPGSGMFGEFVDVSANIETGGEDSDTVPYKIGIPVELSKFNVNKLNNKAILNWTTQSEINNSHFVIERSADGKQYHEVGQVEGAGTSTTENVYEFLDDRPVMGVNYYRLKQMDYDGSYNYSQIVQVEFNYRSGSANLDIGPNPIHDFIHFKSDNLVGSIHVLIFDKNGQKKYDNHLHANEKIDLNGYANGLYIVKVYDQYRYEIASEKIVILK